MNEIGIDMIDDDNSIKDDNDNASDDSINDAHNLTIQDGLSAETLSLLLQFLPTRRFEDDLNDNTHIEDSNVCVAYTDKDINVITETVNRLTKKNEEETNKRKIAAESRVLLPLLNTILDDDIYNTLVDDGIVRVNGILSVDHCDKMLDFINNKLADELLLENPQTQETGFGNVLCRENRWDMYLHNENACHGALNSILGEKEKLGILFHRLFNGADAEFHELSSLISDLGANAQPIHPDSVFTALAPLYTIFIALQDICQEMGPTIFLPKTNSQECHTLHKNASTKDEFLGRCEYRQSTLKKGDCCIMDSRTLHSGDANFKGRRVLLYFTLRNPVNFYLCDPAIPTGSKWENDEIKLSDFR